MTLIIAMNPLIAGYTFVQNGGRQSSVKFRYAVGRRCTNAVAMSTPVPKCLLMKSAWFGTGSRGNRRIMRGKEQARVERKRIRKRAKTCAARL